MTLGVDLRAAPVSAYCWKHRCDHNRNLTIVNDQMDQTFRFMHSKDGCNPVLDCSSECAMAC